MTMSPAATAAFPFLFDTLRRTPVGTYHPLLPANLLVLFVLVHIVQVLLFGVVNLTRSMITGRYVVKPERAT
jgi:thiosulfate reductase cytochrome b subunit